MKKNKRLLVALLGLLMCLSFGVTTVAFAANPDVYDFSALFTYENAQGEWGSNAGTIANSAHWGENSFKIVSTGTGAEANGSSAKMKGVFSSSIQFTMNAIPKAGAATASDYAFRVLRMRIADALNPTDYFDLVIHNKHAWLPAPSIYPNTTDPSATTSGQGSLSYIEYNGVKKSTGDPENTGGMPVPDLPFGGAMQGGFCGTTRLSTNMTVKFDPTTHAITVQDGSANGVTMPIIYDWIGKNFEAKLYTVEFIFDEVEPDQKAGIAIANINCEYGDFWTNTLGSKTEGSTAKVVANDPIGVLGKFRPARNVSIPTTETISVYDFEHGLTDLAADNARLSYAYRLEGSTGDYTNITGTTIVTPAISAAGASDKYELFVAVDGGDKTKVGSFIVTDSVALNIVISGANPLEVAVKTTATAPAAVAKDDENNEYEVTSNFATVVDFDVVGNYVVTYTAVDPVDDSKKYTKTLIVKVVDKTVPQLTLNGDAVVELALGGTFTDAGCSVSDNYDTEIDYTVTGSVDTAVAGVYTLTYTATDTSGNVASVTRTVRVVDNIKPTIDISGNVTSGSLGQKIFLGVINATDNSGQTPTVTVTVTDENGTPVTVDTTENCFTPDKNGKYTVTITATDASGQTETKTYTVEIGKPKSNVGAIVGISVGASVGGILLLVGGGILIMRHKKKRA